jgi:hypothetical protein
LGHRNNNSVEPVERHGPVVSCTRPRAGAGVQVPTTGCGQRIERVTYHRAWGIARVRIGRCFLRLSDDCAHGRRRCSGNCSPDAFRHGFRAREGAVRERRRGSSLGYPF